MTCRRNSLLIALLMFAAAPAAQAAPTIKEAGWTKIREISFSNAQSARINPKDGAIYVARRQSSGGIYRVDAFGLETKIASASYPSALLITANGDLFWSEDHGGNIYRVAYKTTTKQTWVSGFHSGDDDPVGMSIVVESSEPAEAAVDSGVATCGDGVVDVNEACDDGGRAISDGCSDLCQIEPGYLCAGTRSICRMIASTALVDHAAAHCPASGDGSTRRPFCTIEEGLLSHRATVLVMPGTYNEALIVDSGTTELHAAGAVELDGDMQIALTIGGGATVEVHSFTIRSRVTAVLIHNRNTIARLFDNYIGPSLNFGVDVKNNTDVTFERNRIEQCLGGGIKLDTAVAYRAVNNVVVRNGTDTSEFGGFYVKRIAAQATLTNNTIVGNTSSPMQAAGVRCNHRTVAVINSIIWANLSGTVPSTTDSNCATTYCDGGPTPSQPAHATDFTMAPDFRLDDSYRLNSRSPWRDRGDPAGIEPNGPAPPRDFDHQLRNDARVDVGADEFGL